MKRLLAALLLVTSSLAYGQTTDTTTSTTGELVDPNDWQGVIYMTQGHLQQVEGTGGGPVPAYNIQTNTIRFSYWPYTTYQIMAINQALFNANTNVQISGYNYNWKIYLDNGWVRGDVSLLDTSNQPLETYSHYYDASKGAISWQQFSGTQNFTNQYSVDNVSALSMSWTGSDSLFWSGYYGPRVRDVSLSLNYTVGTTSPIIPAAEPTPTAIVEAPIAEPVAEPIAEVVVTEPVVTTTTPAPVVTEPVVELVASNPATVSSVAATSSSGDKPSVDTLAIAKNILRRDSELTSSIVSSSIESSTGSSIQSEVAPDTLASSDTSTSGSSSSSSQRTTAIETAIVQQSIAQSGPEQTSTSQTGFSAQTLSAFASTDTVSSETFETVESTNNAVVEVSVADLIDNRVSSSSDTAVVADDVNPTSVRSLAAMLSTNTAELEEQEEQDRQRVNEIVANSVTPNELVTGGVDLALLQALPSGYSTYLNLIIKDASFYAPKEIYRNQTVVDNAPVQRRLQLTSDVKFEEMVSQQYGEKK